jgi:hypothetical protein
VRPELQPALDAARTLAPEELPHLIGELEELKATCLARLTSPAIDTKDELLDVPEAAARLSVSTEYLYRNHRRLPFTRRIGKRLLFSSNGLAEYVKKSR